MNKKEISKKLYSGSTQTFLDNLRDAVPGFSGLRYLTLPRDIVMGMNSDGIGTKVELAERMDKYDTIAYDLVAMVCDDAISKGGVPVAISSVLDINNGKHITESKLDELVIGYINAAKEANVSILNGETAELGNRINSSYDIYSFINDKLPQSKHANQFRFNWSASVVWFAKKNKLLTGLDIKPGDSLVGFKEPGFRSNGYSKLNEILTNEFGNDWHEKLFNDKTLGEYLLTPSNIYTRTIVDLLGGLSEPKNENVTGITHITGGGLPEKLGRTLEPTGLSYRLTNPITPPPIFSYLQKLGKLTDEQANKIWNMGTGMVVITKDEDEAIRIADRHNLEAQVIGYIQRK